MVDSHPVRAAPVHLGARRLADDHHLRPEALAERGGPGGIAEGGLRVPLVDLIHLAPVYEGEVETEELFFHRRLRHGPALLEIGAVDRIFEELPYQHHDARVLLLRPDDVQGADILLQLGQRHPRANGDAVHPVLAVVILDDLETGDVPLHLRENLVVDELEVLDHRLRVDDGADALLDRPALRAVGRLLLRAEHRVGPLPPHRGLPRRDHLLLGRGVRPGAERRTRAQTPRPAHNPPRAIPHEPVPPTPPAPPQGAWTSAAAAASPSRPAAETGAAAVGRAA